LRTKRLNTEIPPAVVLAGAFHHAERGTWTCEEVYLLEKKNYSIIFPNLCPCSATSGVTAKGVPNYIYYYTPFISGDTLHFTTHPVDTQ